MLVEEEVQNSWSIVMMAEQVLGELIEMSAFGLKMLEEVVVLPAHL